MNNEDDKAVKSISGGSILSWLLGVIIAIVGIATREVVVVLAGVILLPVTNTLAKKYLKVNFSGAARVVIVLVLIIGSFAASSSWGETPSESANNPSVAEEYTEIISLQGKGNQNTQSFSVTGNKVRVTATTCCGTTSSGSFSGVELKKEEGRAYLGPEITISTDGGEKGEGQTIYRNLSPGKYYIQVISGVGWSVKVEQSN